MNLYKIAFRLLPWLLLIIGALVVMLRFNGLAFKTTPEMVEVNTSSLLSEVEALGTLNTVRQTVTLLYEYKKETQKLEILPGIKLQLMGPDTEVMMLVKGEVVGCIDFGQISVESAPEADTLVVRLPTPKICFYKLNLNGVRIIALESTWGESDAELLLKALKKSEAQILEDARQSGIIKAADENARLVIKPFIEKLVEKPVVIKGTFTETVDFSKLDKYPDVAPDSTLVRPYSD